MLLRNIKTGIESIVTKEQYQQMVDTKRSLLFKVINTSEAKAPTIPDKITEFKVSRPERIVNIPIDVHVTAEITNKSKLKP
jgi:hypothetical protein